MKRLFKIFMHKTIVPESVGAISPTAEDIQLVENANKNWNDTFNQSNSDALAMLYADAATLSPGNGEILVGRIEIAALFQSFFDNGVQNHSIEPVSIYRDHDQIVQVGKWHAEAIDDNQNKTAFGGVLVTVLQQQNGKWLLCSHVWNMAA